MTTGQRAPPRARGNADKPGAAPRARRVPIDEALLIARQIAEAIEAAHEAGIIHRDLKPANITVRHDGQVKSVDKRADIWAFGVVFSEMLTGRRAFPGANATEVLALRVARNGTLAYVPSHSLLSRLVSVARDGAALPLDLPPGNLQTPRLSPDRRRVLVTDSASVFWQHGTASDDRRSN